jgi:hypothetical protein
MTSDSTLNYLILYLYNETWMADSVLIQHAIDTDPETEQEFENLKSILGFFDGLKAEPSDESVRKILELV